MGIVHHTQNHGMTMEQKMPKSMNFEIRYQMKTILFSALKKITHQIYEKIEHLDEYVREEEAE